MNLFAYSSEAIFQGSLDRLLEDSPLKAFDFHSQQIPRNIAHIFEQADENPPEKELNFDHNFLSKLIPKIDDFDHEGCEEIRIPLKYLQALKSNLETSVSILKGIIYQKEISLMTPKTEEIEKEHELNN